MPTAKQVYCGSTQDSKRRHSRQMQRSNGRYASGVPGETEAACRVVVDYTPPLFHSAASRNRAMTQASRTPASTSVSTATLPSPATLTTRARLPPPRLVAPPSKRRRMLQEQRTQNVTLPSWEAFHKTQQQLEMTCDAKKIAGTSAGNGTNSNQAQSQGVSPLDALASVAMREAVTKNMPGTQTTEVNVRIPTKKDIAAALIARQKQEQELMYLQEMQLQKAVAAQELHEANLVVQAKQALAARHHAAMQHAQSQLGHVNLVMDYSNLNGNLNLPQLQMMPQGLESVQFLPHGLECYAPNLLAQHQIAADPRIFIGNGPFNAAALDGADKMQQAATATLNEHVASVWQKYNHENVSALLRKSKGGEVQVMGSGAEADWKAVPLKKRKMDDEVLSMPPPKLAAGGLAQV